MIIRSFKTMAERLFHDAGIEVNGNQAWDIQIHDNHFYSRVLRSGSLAFGESYVEGEWDVERLDILISRLIKARLGQQIRPLIRQISELRSRLVNLQTKHRSLEVAHLHYNLCNEFYEAMLDKNMAYSCGYWRDTDDLEIAQNAKLKLLCEKLQLKPQMRVLDIGCGWGSFSKYAAEHYDVAVVGINISTEQIKHARKRCKGLNVEIRNQDYRDINETFDAIVSVGMFEHVGHHNYREYMQVAHRCLHPDGLFLLHTIGKLNSHQPIEPWIERYIFPNAELPSLSQISKSCEDLFLIEDLHNIGADYDKTLVAWFDNFKLTWPKFQHRFDQRFYRMWKYYLLGCAGASRARSMQVWQLVLSPAGVSGGYLRYS